MNGQIDQLARRFPHSLALIQTQREQKCNSLRSILSNSECIYMHQYLMQANVPETKQNPLLFSMQIKTHL